MTRCDFVLVDRVDVQNDHRIDQGVNFRSLVEISLFRYLIVPILHSSKMSDNVRNDYQADAD